MQSCSLLFRPYHLTPQLQEDKVLHFAAGAASGFIGAKIADKISNKDPNWRIIGAFHLQLLVGFGQRGSYETSIKGGIMMTSVTALGGVTVGITINIFSGREIKRKLWQGLP
ncbi:MAG: hypothetical protein R2814_01035 [Flavobacteriaceae bacterium]